MSNPASHSRPRLATIKEATAPAAKKIFRRDGHVRDFWRRGGHAYEFGSPGYLQKPGIVLGAAAAAPPPGLYGFEQAFTYQSKLVGPGAPSVGARRLALS